MYKNNIMYEEYTLYNDNYINVMLTKHKYIIYIFQPGAPINVNPPLFTIVYYVNRTIIEALA